MIGLQQATFLNNFIGSFSITLKRRQLNDQSSVYNTSWWTAGKKF